MSKQFSLLSKPAILENLGKGIVIHPYNEENLVEDMQLKSCSYDVRIGQEYYIRRPSEQTGDTFFNPYDPHDISEHFGAFQVAKPAQDSPIYNKQPSRWNNIDPNDLIIVLKPGEMILGHTLEFIGGTKDPDSGRCFVAEMKARSSVGRLGFEVCRCAGWGDVGYVNRWTMEIVNTTWNTIPLIVGTRVAQMKFYEVAPIKDEDLYGADPNRDHYQMTHNLEELQRSWKPEMMLPRITKT